LLLRFLKLRLVVNDMNIYSLRQNKPVVVHLPENPSKVVVTDGYHITPPVKIPHLKKERHYYIVACAIENDALIGCGICMLLLFSMGASSDTLVLEILSLFPIAYILYLYYINRKEFIKIRAI
jgi:hypothetical protein